MGNSTSSGSSTLKQPSGIEQLNDSVWKFYSPSTGVPAVDVVFFHGFQMSDSKEAFWKTWLSRDESVLWPKDWLSECLPRARILSMSYDATLQKHDGVNDPYLITENLIVDMLDDKVLLGQKCPVVLVGHSFGGIMIKEVILECFTQILKSNRAASERWVDQIENFLGNCKGVFYYSTPHGGSAILDRASSIPSMNKLLLELLTTLSVKTARINQNFQGARANKQIKTQAIVENRDTKIMVTERPIVARVVGEASARQDVDKYYTADADHFEVCKPKNNKTCAIFRHLLEFINEILQSKRSRISKEEGAVVDPLKCLSEQDDPSNTDYGPTRLRIAELVKSLFDIHIGSRSAAAWELEKLTEKAIESMKVAIAEEEGVIVGLVKCLSGNTNPHLQEGAAWTLSHLTGVEHPDSIRSRVFNEEGAIDALVKCLSMANKPDLQEAAAWTLCHLIEWDVDGGSIRSSLTKEDRTIVGLVKCLSVLKKPDLRAAAAWILYNLTGEEDDDDSMKLRVAEIQGAIVGLKKCLSVPDLIEPAKGTLRNLSKIDNQSIKLRIAEEGGAMVL